MNIRAALESAGVETQRPRAYNLLVAFARNKSPDAMLSDFLKRNGVSYDTLAAIALAFVRNDIHGRLGGQINGVASRDHDCPAAEPTYSGGADRRPSAATSGQEQVVPPSLPERSGDLGTAADSSGHRFSVAGSSQGEESDRAADSPVALHCIVAPSPTERSGDHLPGASGDGSLRETVAGSPQGEGGGGHARRGLSAQNGPAAPSPSACPADQINPAVAPFGGQVRGVCGAPESRAADQRCFVGKPDQDAHVPARPQAREPTSAFIKAAAEERTAIARSILYSRKTSNGTLWADIHPYEVVAMNVDSVRGMALLSVCGPLSEKQMRMTFGELLSPGKAKLAFEKADAEIAHVA